MCIHISHMFPALNLARVLIRVGTEEDVRDLLHTVGPTN